MSWRLLCAFGIAVLPLACSHSGGDESAAEVPDAKEAAAKTATSEIKPVPTNRGPHVQDGFRGDVHPALAPDATLEVDARCVPIGKGRGFAAGYFPPQFRAPFDSFAVNRRVQTHAAKTLSAFLPESFQDVGQMWEIDAERLLPLLRQFHTGASVKLGAPGRRGGPNGAFAILRGVSDSHYDVLARVHAEFVLEPGVYLTPAYYEGRLLVNRRTRAIDFFSLSLPADLGLNTTLTVVRPAEALIDIVHLDRMELTGGSGALVKSVAWKREVDWPTARRKLKGTFYKFIDIQWVKPELAVERARRQNRPILAIVLWGDLDDQSC